MKIYKPLRRLRIAVSLLLTALIVYALFRGQLWLVSRMQFGVALIAGSGGWVAVWALVTALFGRLYCSTACPLGVLMDLIRWLRPRRRRFAWHPANNRLRYTLMALSLVCSALGIGLVVALLEPYSIFARSLTLTGRSLLATGVIVAMTLGIVLLAFSRGRLWCNTVCPVGSILSCLSRYSTYHVDINTDLCVQCGRCAARCPAECINLQDHTVDISRCVMCMDCLTDCPNSAITYRRGRHQLVLPMMQKVETKPAMGMTAQSDSGAVNAASKTEERPQRLDRRAFMTSLALTGIGSVLALAERRSGLKPDSVRVPGMTALKAWAPVTPPGIESMKQFLHQCTACGACVKACPMQVLKPSTAEYGVRHAMVPMKDYDSSFCAFDCRRCTTVCPTRALNPLSVSEKHDFTVGTARVAIDHCIQYALGEACGVCVRCCPKQAVRMMPAGDGRTAPLVDIDACIGCGECQYRCPAEPRAIVVEGL